MRVIAGRWKGRRLKSPAGEQIRPTTDRVKEAMFSILGSDIRDCLFLDLCCGTGGLGIEALSRGAASAVFIDRSRPTLAMVRENLELCGAEEEQTRLVCADAAAWLSRWKPPVGLGSWILVADPPYRCGAAGAIMKEMGRLGKDPGFRAGVIEHGPDTPDLPSETPDHLDWRTRKYGLSYLAVVRPTPADPREGE
jgi:16S rRNA (guanine966-N2)-methyltransferase